MAQITAAKHSRTVFNAPKFLRKYLEVVNDRERKHNAPQIKWLKNNGLWDEAREKIKDGGGDVFFNVIEESSARERSFQYRIESVFVQFKQVRSYRARSASS
jgi:hypothetical protein